MCKPILTYQQQVQHLVDKGVTFDHITKEDAIFYLQQNNNLFKLSAYRKNFPKRDGKNLYVHLDFSYLIDLAVIDTRLRMLIVEMALNIEHFAKVYLLKRITESDAEDGYSIVTDYIASLSEPEADRLRTELDRNRNSIYVRDIYQKYNPGFPVWAFVEMLSFGHFIHFYKFCASRLNDKAMRDNVYLFLSVKQIRNASAHNNCLLNDLIIKSHTYNVNYGVKQALSKIGIKYNQRRKKLACERTAQIITCLYTHRRIVVSKKTHLHISAKLNDFKQRLFRDYDYTFNSTIFSTFRLLQKIIDNWFPTM